MVLQATLCAAAFYGLPYCTGHISVYNHYLYYPWQAARGWLLFSIPFSVGDVVYVAAGLGLAVMLIKWVVYIVKLSTYSGRLGASFLNFINTVLFAYLLFIAGWGANYYKAPLAKYWELSTHDTTLKHLPAAAYKLKVKTDLTAFDSFLVTRLNEYAPHYHALTLDAINNHSKRNYELYTDSHLKKNGLGVKPSLFGYFMERTGVEGYYNPFTGEGQINNRLPAFILPFLVSHEIAHQAGVAAEGDANLTAYAVCTADQDSTFRYSAYLEIWLYTNRRLYYRDSSAALKLEASLNKLTSAHLDTLEQLSKKYDNDYARYSAELYDGYLKMQDQKEGIRSYSNVAASAWLLEQRRMQGKKGLINIP